MKKKVPIKLFDDRAIIALLDLQRINAAAEELNSEAEEILEYQAGNRTKDGTES